MVSIILMMIMKITPVFYSANFKQRQVHIPISMTVIITVIARDAPIFPYLITLTSQWPRWRLKSPASRLFTQSFIRAQIKENIKAPRHWPLCGKFTGTGEFPAQRASNAENASIWRRHHVKRKLVAETQLVSFSWMIFLANVRCSILSVCLKFVTTFA